MSYYILSNSTDTKIIGKTYHQTKGLPKGYTSSTLYSGSTSMTELNNEKFPLTSPKLIFELEDTAILTDVVSPGNISASGFLVNNKVKSVLEKIEVLNFKYYPAIVIYKDEQIEYSWLHFITTPIEELIDLKNSSFYLSEFGFDKGKHITFNNTEEGREIAKEDDSFIQPETLVVNQKYKSIDLFYLPLSYEIIASQNLNELIVENNITGFSFKKIE